ncbi:diguanylate cyclase [Rubrobacter xylanophilus DSM 9941]|uniref:Diguanylate cyclase n=1 Tax=Rubrobacter xylanophilus (strain DSM 9941 / JCM 11954 / NBRC 16129 / PRD-1) TaxID=266117 RepID=Q1ASP5_RUBXD|nr:GAF domain-containing protein [Rubrobacter xylanophilus]ABG05583.1 diguanylate cyclase [Rubrobacter xylanophilus DSM 9941]
MRAGRGEVQRGRSLPALLRRGGPAGKRPARAVAYAETLAALALLVGAGLLLQPQNPGFAGVSPHPFWLVVIPIAALHGSPPGYVAGAASALAYLGLAALQAGSVTDPALLRPGLLAEPVLFLVAGGALGELRQAQRRREEALLRRQEALEGDLQDLAQRYLASVELARELERRIVDQTSTVTTLYEAAKALERLEVEELPPAVLELASSFVDVEACSLYLLRDGSFVLEAGRPEGAPRPRQLDVGGGLPAIVASEKRLATVHELLAEPTPGRLARQPMLMAAPILDADGEVAGMLVAERMPFLRFTPAAARLFSLLGDWASGAFQRALRFRQTRDRNIEDDLTGAYNHAYLLKRAEEEVFRSRTYGVPLSLLALRAEDHERIPPVRLPGVLRTLSLVFRHHIRPVDVLGRHEEEGTFLLLLPHLGAEEAGELAERLRREVEGFGFRPFEEDDRTLRLRTGRATLSGKTGGAEGLVEEAVRDLLRGGG